MGLQKSDLKLNAPIQLVNTGNSFILIPVKDNKILENIVPDYNLISQISEEFDLIGYYVFTTQTYSLNSDANTRMFAPSYGILEESGTGMAAGPLASYLYDILKINKTTFNIQQGQFMKNPSPSLILVNLEVKNGVIQHLMAGGKGLLKKEMKIEIEL